MSALRLSICIATLNRAAFLSETLEALVRQATDEVEIVVVDGASTDHTPEVVQGYARRCPRVRYVRLEAKGGVDKDYCLSVDHAQGDYCWLFTDDDLLKPGAVAAVLQAMCDNPGLIIVNAEVRTADLAVCLQARRIKFEQDRDYALSASEEGHRLLADTADYLSFIGGVVIRRDIWNQRKKEPYYGTEFVHVGVIFQCPIPGIVRVMAYPWIIIRYGNALWVSRHFQIWMFKWPNLVWSFPDFPDWAKERVVAREPWRHWPILALYRAMERYSLKEYTEWLESRLSCRLRKFVCRGIAQAPVSLLNRLARWYVQLRMRNRPCITLCDLDAWREQQRRKSTLPPAG